jgi:hypothetical protein
VLRSSASDFIDLRSFHEGKKRGSREELLGIYIGGLALWRGLGFCADLIGWLGGSQAPADLLPEEEEGSARWGHRVKGTGASATYPFGAGLCWAKANLGAGPKWLP